MTQRIMPLCKNCRHYIGRDDHDVPVCRAFPKEIPEAIWFNDQLHLSPMSGDGGIQYEPIEGREQIGEEILQDLK